MTYLGSSLLLVLVHLNMKNTDIIFSYIVMPWMLHVNTHLSTRPWIYVAAHVSQKHMHMYVYFTYYQPFNITVNHFPFNKIVINIYYLAFCHKRSTYSLSRYLRILDGASGHPWLSRALLFLQTQMKLGFQIQRFFIEIQWTFLNLFSSAFAPILNWTKLHFILWGI